MFSGIKLGKKKKQQKSNVKDPPSSSIITNESKNSGRSLFDSSTNSTLENSSVTDQFRQSLAEGTSQKSNRSVVDTQQNYSVADQLRQSLAAGVNLPIEREIPTKSVASFNGLERRGRIQPAMKHDKRNNNTSDDVVLLMDNNKSNLNNSMNQSTDNMTIQDMLKEEHRTKNTSLAESESRNAIRLGKKRKSKESSMGNVDSDEEEYRQMQNISSLKVMKQKEINNFNKREITNQIKQYDIQSNITSKCWWWIECGNNKFEKHRLLALGNYVTLIMVPFNISLNIYCEHFYLVPIQHCESLSSCDENIWNEIILFQNSLRKLYKNENKSIIFFETVLNTNSFWQTKLECIVLPNKIALDTQLYFKSGLNDIAEEWGTHQKIIKTGTTNNVNNTKDLRHSIPKNFAYFYIEYNDNNDGYVQMIESNEFPKDFGIDIITSMLKIDPIRFGKNKNKKDKSSSLSIIIDEEKQAILKFLEKWKLVDWTIQLD